MITDGPPRLPSSATTARTTANSDKPAPNGGSARITGIGHRLRHVGRSGQARGSTAGTATVLAAQLAYRLCRRSVPDWNDAEAVPLLAGRWRDGCMGR
jgi:hypothetical protein